MAADMTAPEYWESNIARSLVRFAVLATIAEQPRHGYEIQRLVPEICGDCCVPSDAMLYPTLRDLEADGLVQSEADVSGPRKRNLCSLTPRGREAFQTAARVWARHLPRIQTLVDEGLAQPVGAVRFP